MLEHPLWDDCLQLVLMCNLDFGRWCSGTAEGDELAWIIVALNRRMFES